MNSSSRQRHRLLLPALAVSLALALMAPRFAFAQQHAVNEAESLIEQARKLLADGRVSEACATFERSQKLAPDVGTLLQLGNCYQRDGRTASAWLAFREAIGVAHDSGQAERERFARERAQALERDVVRLTITMHPQTASIPGLTVSRDNTILSNAELGVPTPIDPGRHTISARAPGKKSWSAIVDINRAPGREPTNVEIPILEEMEGAASPPPALEPPPGSGAAESPSGGGGPAPNSTLFTTGLVVGGAAVVIASAATGFALSAQSKEDDLEALTKSRGTWSSEYQRTYDDGSDAATAATVLFVTGGLMLAVGATLMLVNWPSAQRASAKNTTSWSTWTF